MLLFVPAGVGIAIGLIILAFSSILKKRNTSLAKLPPIIGFIISIVIFVISFSVRGFEGAAYGITAFVVLVFALISFFTSTNKTTKSQSHVNTK